MITPGTRPDLDFPVTINRDGKKTEVQFSELISGPTLVSVYMRNNTSACDLQAASLAAHAGEIAKLGWNVVAVSRDTCASHAKYAAKLGIAFTLVSDPEFSFAKAADSMVEKSMYGKKYLAPERAAYLFDAGGKVISIIPKVDAANHGQQALAAITALGR
jgi:peroxiredoxin Q/BCP